MDILSDRQFISCSGQIKTKPYLQNVKEDFITQIKLETVLRNAYYYLYFFPPTVIPILKEYIVLYTPLYQSDINYFAVSLYLCSFNSPREYELLPHGPAPTLKQLTVLKCKLMRQLNTVKKIILQSEFCYFGGFDMIQ